MAGPPLKLISISAASRNDQPDVLAEIGQVLTSSKSFSEAEQYLQQAIALDPDNYGANFGLLQLFARTADPRRDAQAARFDQVKAKKETADRDMMRVIEIQRDTPTAQTQP